MPKSKASKEPPKVKEEETVIECEETTPENPQVIEATPSIETPPIITEAPIEVHLAGIVIQSFEEGKEDVLYTGNRTVQYKGGHLYSGDFLEGKMHGEGEYLWSHGLKYTGDFKENVITGEGSYVWADGSAYRGDVESGLRHGKGTFFCATNPSVYSGDWVRGKRTGTGKISYDREELSYYMGDWVDNRKCGKGYRQYSSGSTYSGDWLDNLRHGTGTMSWEGTGESYTGQWHEGVQHGEGTQTWTVDTSSQLPLRNTYQGSWKNGMREGSGLFSYASGARYEGEWKDNMKHGFGKFFFKDGSVFSGNFENDSILGRPGSPDMGKMMRSAIVTGRISSPLQNVAKTAQSSFELNISSLIADDIFHEEELQQVHNVLLRHITHLRGIYNHYCKLSQPDSGILARMEFWKFLKDIQLYLKVSMPAADAVISESCDIECETERESPFTQFLFREFLQALVHLSVKVYSGAVVRENGSFVAKCLSGMLHDHVLPLNTSLQTGFSHSHSTNKQYIERCWTTYQKLQNRTKSGFTLREVLFVLKDLKLIGVTFPHLDVSRVVQEIMLSGNENMSREGELFLDIEINFYDFFNVLCGCALVMKHSPTHILDGDFHSQLGTETDMSTGGGLLLSPDKTPLPPASESPTKSLSKKNTPSATPIQTPAPSAADTDNADQEGSTPIADSVATLENIREQSFLISPSIDERCGSYEDWDSRVEDFFLCHFFPAADNLLDIESRVYEQRLALMEARKAAEAQQVLVPEVPSIALKSPSLVDPLGDQSENTNTSTPAALVVVG